LLSQEQVSYRMAGKIIVDRERCKGCGLCVWTCPHEVIRISAEPNSVGIFPAEAANDGCTGCALCALTCPDVAITVLRETRTKVNPNDTSQSVEA